MNSPTARYLSAKRSVDDRSLSCRVSNRLWAEVPRSPRILELGCGTGITIPRLISRGLRDGSYRGIDRSDSLIEHARYARPRELEYRGHELTETTSGYRVADLDFRFEIGEAIDTLRESGPVDLIIAQQFMDLVAIEAFLDALAETLVPGGLAYFPLTFDGMTLFQPDHPADRAIERAYHADMTEDGRDSRAGRHLATELQHRSGRLLALDSSDAIVRPREGTYPADEKYFLSCLLDFVADAVDASVPGRADWLETRRKQCVCGELLYVGHRYDLLYQR